KWKGTQESWRLRIEGKFPAANFSPLPIVASLQKQQARILTPSKKVTKSIKSSITWLINTVRKLAGTSLYPEASRGLVRSSAAKECCTSCTFWFWGTDCVGQYWFRF